MKLESYLNGRWQAGSGAGRPLINPVTGNEMAPTSISCQG
jgi:hypothetical protein